MPIFAQQSIREMTRTGRSPEQVIGDAFKGAAAGGYEGPQGADADHLKTNADIDRTAAAGFCFFTLDPSEMSTADADSGANSPIASPAAGGREMAAAVCRSQESITERNDADDRRRQTTMRAALKYGLAVTHAIELARYVDATMRKSAARTRSS